MIPTTTTDKLEIVLPTYNRKERLARTLNQLLANDSPVRDCKLTILDNCSDDGSSDLICETVARFNNVTHIRRNRNVGANVNVATAYEIANKEYLWILCDDDAYDFTAWNEVESAIERGESLILVSKYVLDIKSKGLYLQASILSQASFVPATIYKTDFITDSLVRTIYNFEYTMYPQLVAVIDALNKGRNFYVLRGEDIVINGDNYGLTIGPMVSCANYIRGASATDLPYKDVHMSQLSGVFTCYGLIKDKYLAAFLFNQIRSAAFNYLKHRNDWIFFFEIFYACPRQIQNRWMLLLPLWFFRKIAHKVVNWLGMNGR